MTYYIATLEISNADGTKTITQTHVSAPGRRAAKAAIPDSFKVVHMERERLNSCSLLSTYHGDDKTDGYSNTNGGM